MRLRRSGRHGAFFAAALLCALGAGGSAIAQAPGKAGPAKAASAAGAPAASGSAASNSAAASASGSASAAAAAPNVQELAKKFSEAAKANDWPRAYETMQAAFAVQKTFDILGNLGSAELQLGKYPAAAEHLAWSLHEFPAIGKPEAKKVTEDMLAKATANVGTLRLKISPPHARVRVDERVYGPTDYREMVFVEPGDVTISAGDANGYVPVQKQIHVEKGKSIDVELELKADGGVGPVASGKASASAAPSGTAMTAGPNKVVLGAGIGLTVASLAAGIGLLVGSATKKSEADNLRQELLNKNIFQLCDKNKSDPNCQKFFDAGNTGQSLGNVGASLLIGAGAVGAATAIYYVITRQKTAPPPVKAGLAIGPSGGQLAIEGKF